MKGKLKFFKCMHCGNIVEMIHSGGGILVCCGDPMNELIANTSDGANEKHVPVVSVNGGRVHVAVGSIEHPMLEEHYIMWIVLETCCGVYRKCLKPGEKPEAVFELSNGETPVAAYEYCNIHGLWKAEL